MNTIGHISVILRANVNSTALQVPVIPSGLYPLRLQTWWDQLNAQFPSLGG
jgi:hypothetical protein